LDTQGRLLREQIEQTNREITTELELEKKQNEEREKAARLEQEIARAKTAASLELIKGNPQLTEDQKRDQSLPLMQTQSDENQARLSQLSGDMANPASSDEARLDAEKQYYDLKVKEAQLQNQINAAQNASNFGAQFADVVTKLQNINTLAQSCAQVFGGAVNTAVNSISTNISGVIMGTKTWKQALTGIYNAIVTDIVQGLVHMAVQWALQHVIMSAISSAFHIGENAKTAAAETTQVSITSAGTTTRIVIRTGEAAHDAAMTGVQVATHAAGETTKTGWTFMHAVMRNASRLFETIFHGIMTALRTAVHIVGETTATGVTMAQSLIRATAYLITAAVGAMQAMANIPYVGPVLAIVAAAAIIGAGVALMAGFEKGGYTGNTNRNAVAGVVHGGEFVMDASTVDRVGVQNLEAIRSGRNPDTSAPSGGTGGGSKNTSVYAFLDPRQMADHLERNDDHEKWVVDVMGRNIHKFR
jgi:hypothetical protein